MVLLKGKLKFLEMCYRLTPLHELGHLSDLNNFRSIAVLLIVLKIFECVLSIINLDSGHPMTCV